MIRTVVILVGSTLLAILPSCQPPNSAGGICTLVGQETVCRWVGRDSYSGEPILNVSERGS